MQLNVTADRYPYLAGKTTLDSILPAWCLEGGKNRLLQLIDDLKALKKIEKPLIEKFSNKEAWNDIQISSVSTKKNKKFEGLKIEEISKIVGKSPFRTLINLLKEEKFHIDAIFWGMSEDNLRTILKHWSVMIASDADPWVLLDNDAKPHPRTFGAFPRVIAKYVKDEKLLDLSEAIKKMTYLPSTKIGLRKRGLLEEGYYADIIIFNYHEIRDNSTYEDPIAFPSGIHNVIVNGKFVLENGEYTGILPGEIIRNV